MKILIDADLILELLINRSKVVKDAEVIWKLAESHHIEGFVTNAGLEKIYFYCRELTDETLADGIVESLEKVLSSCSIDQNIIRKATSSQLKDFESAIEFICAKSMGFDGVVTHCLHNFSGSDSSVWSVHELLVALKNNEKNQEIEINKKLLSFYSQDVILEDKDLKESWDIATFFESNIYKKSELLDPNILKKLYSTSDSENVALENITNEENIFKANNKCVHPVVKDIYIQENLRLSNLKLKLSFLTAVLSLIIGLIGCVLLLTGKAKEGAVATIIGGIASAAGNIFVNNYRKEFDKLSQPTNSSKYDNVTVLRAGKKQVHSSSKIQVRRITTSDKQNIK